MLSLPEDWDYTLAGLSQINREKIDAIREAIKELERAGYIVRSRERDEKGRKKRWNARTEQNAYAAGRNRANLAYGGEKLSQRRDERQDHNPDKDMENRVCQTEPPRGKHSIRGILC